MGRLRMKAAGCKDEESDIRLKVQFINGMYNKKMTNEIITKLTSIKTQLK